jgi:hypothetical protein
MNFAFGKLQGLTEGRLKERREMALLQLAAKSGSLAPAVQERVAPLPSGQLRQLLDLVKSPARKDRCLEH